MLVFIGILVLCVVFVVFGGNTEGASILYYDMDDTVVTIGGENAVDAPIPKTDKPVSKTKVPEGNPEDIAAVDEAKIAQDIYSSIEL